MHDEHAAGVEVLVDGPFSASTTLWRARNGELRCTVVAKSTYKLRPSRSPLIEPEPIHALDVTWDGTPARSVRFPSDVAPFKRSAEVVLVGHAHAPGGKAERRVAARLLVGDIDVALQIFPLRRFSHDHVLDAPLAAKMPLAYEHAAGGPETDNPVGIDTGLADLRGRRTAPSVLQAGHSYASPEDHAEPAGFGPIGGGWPSRQRRLRPEDGAWLDAPTKSPLPAGFDVRYFQSAPRDQWLAGPLRPDERLHLENLCLGHERLVTSLEAVVPYASVVSGVRRRLPLVADMLFIDTDRGLATLTWRGRARVEEHGHRPVVAVAREGARKQTWPLPPGSAGDASADVETTSVEGLAGPSASALPFLAKASERGFGAFGPGEAPQAHKSAFTRRPAPAVQGLPGNDEGDTTAVPPPRSPAPRASVPFVEPAPFMPPAPPAAPAFMPPAPPAEPAFIAPAPPAAPAPSSPPSPEPRPMAATPAASKPAWAPHFAPVAPVKVAPPSVPFAAWTGAREASDLAAERERQGDAVAARPAAANSPSPMDQGACLGRHVLVDLLGMAPALPARLRGSASHRAILGASLERPAWARADEAKVASPREDRDRMDVLRVLSFGAPCDLPRVRALVEEACADALQLELPLVVVAGQLEPTHDEVEVLRAATLVGRPLGTTNRALQTALKVVQEALDGGLSPSAEAASSLMRQVEQAAGPLWAYLHAQVQRCVLEGRKYRRRTLLGEARIRGEITVAGAEPLPIYLPDDVASRLPLLPVFPVVVLAELRPREDAQEAHAEALVALAVGRVVRPAASGRDRA